MTDPAPDRDTAALPPLVPRWTEPSATDPEAVRLLTRELRLPSTVCSVLVSRGVHAPDDAKRFLRPLLQHLHDPTKLADGPEAAARIARAVRRGETILVHGDYDVDGICATALYTRWLRSLGGRVVPFVPHRIRDGYDFGEGGLRAAREAGAALVITADCGTVAAEPVARAREAGMDVVVTDHHTVGARPAAATFLVNPRRPDCGYPDPALCGAGVAFKLCELVGRALDADPSELLSYLDLVALATVADLVPLHGENRVLVRWGLRYFSSTRVPGIAALLEVAGVDPGSVTAGKLGYTVAPRINAAGRLGEAADALRLLLTDDPEEARTLAGVLDGLNRSRQDEDRRTLDQVLERLAREYDPDRDYGVVVAGEGWHPGVIGIVASRVVERIHRPTVLVALDADGAGRGSARSISGFHLYDALDACRHLMGRFGGHAQAAGMDVDRDRVPALREAFNAEARRRLEGEELRPVLRSDVELRLEEADLQLVHWLEYLGPHGIGNPGPVFLARDVRVDGARVVGDRHLKASLVRGADTVDAIGFGLAPRHPPASVNGGSFDVLLRLERNEWRGRTSLQARLVDLRPVGREAP